MDEESVPDVCSIEKINSKVKKKKTIQNNLILFDVGNISSKCKKNVRTKKKIEKISKKSDNCLAENENLITNFENPERAETPNSEDYKLDCSEYKIVEKFVKKILKKKHDHNEKSNTSEEILQMFHISEKEFTCNLCNKAFKHQSSLSTHQKIHKGKNLHKCNHCSKKFAQTFELTVHLRVHSGERPFKCDICSSAFKDNSHLLRHKRTVHQNIELSSYKCDACNMVFWSKNKMLRHSKIHVEPFSCDICSLTFKTLSNLKNHSKTHYPKNQSIECSHCLKKFKYPSDLYRHIRVHIN